MKITEQVTESFPRTYTEITGVKCDFCDTVYDEYDGATNEVRLYIDPGLCVSTTAIRDVCVYCWNDNKEIIDNFMKFMKIEAGQNSEDEED